MMGFVPDHKLTVEKSVEELIGKIESPHMAADYSQADFRRDILKVIKTLVEILDRDP